MPPSELGSAMATGDPSEHLTGRDIEGHIQIRGPMPLVVVGVALDLRWAIACRNDGAHRRAGLPRDGTAHKYGVRLVLNRTPSAYGGCL